MSKRSLSIVVTLLLTVTTVSAISQRRNPIVSGTFVVEPGHYNWNKFDVPEDGARVQGRFRAQGGSGNDIIVLILDEDGFENWRNGHTVNAYYNSGKVTVGTVNTTLSGGSYYVIFSNSFSSVSNKAVTSNIDLVH
jgi:hypothetical protein